MYLRGHDFYLDTNRCDKLLNLQVLVNDIVSHLDANSWF
jgi:hypothetical protein